MESETVTAIWQCDAYRKTRAQAVSEFLRTYWDRERKLSPNRIELDGSFTLADGSGSVRYRIEERDAAPRVYVILRSVENNP